MHLQRLTLVVGVALMASGMTWALWPIRATENNVPLVHPAAATQSEPVPQSLIDPKVFAVNLWHTPPSAPTPPPDDSNTKVAAKPPPKPLNVQLIGIINENGVHRAALYDIDADRLLILGDGDHIRGSTVKTITDTVVELTDGRTTRRLALVQPQPPALPPAAAPSPGLAPTPDAGGEHS